MLTPALSLFLACFCSLFSVCMVRSFHSATPTRPEDRCLADHAVVPLAARVVVPFLLCATFALFAFSNKSIGASVGLSARVAGTSVLDLPLFEFSLLNTVREMWTAEAYALSLLVAVWSGAWPYVKILLMLGAWYAPPRYLPRPHRRRLLLMLDVLGKWALIDLFLMNMMEVAFRFHIQVAARLLVVDVQVTPEIGLFTFVTAVAFSLVSNSVLLIYHRNATHVLDDDSLGASDVSSVAARDADDATLNESLLWTYPDETDALGCCPRDSWFERGTIQALNTHDTTIVSAAESRVSVASLTFPRGALPGVLLDPRTRRIKWWVWPGVCSALVMSMVLIVAAANVDAFEFVYTGLAGDLIGVVDESQLVRRCSLLTIARELSHASEDAPAFGILYQQMLYLLFALVFPLLVLIVALLLVTLQMSLFEFKVCFYALELGMAHASLDVFIVAIIAAVLQVNQFSQFLEKPFCDPLRRAVPGLGNCFAVDTQLLPGTWMIVAAAGFFWCVVQFIQRVVERAVAERERLVLSLCDESEVGCQIRCA